MGIVSVVSGTLYVINLGPQGPYEFVDCVGLSGCTANLIDTEVALTGGSGIVCPFQCNERV